jgi:sortase B
MRKKNRLWLLLLIPCVLLLCFSGYKTFGAVYETLTARNEFSSLARQYRQPEPAAQTAGKTSAEKSEAAPAAASAAAASAPAVLPEFQKLLAENSDIGGWLQIDGTGIDYPVMFTPAEPQKYLRLGFDGADSSHGVPFLGAGCTILPPSENMIVYGHNMNDRSMFAVLENYAQKSFWEAHPIVTFSTLYESHRYEIFSAFASDLQGAEALGCYDADLPSGEAEFAAFLSGLRKACAYDTGAAVTSADKLLTLSTCSYHTQNGRFLVIAKELP